MTMIIPRFSSVCTTTMLLQQLSLFCITVLLSLNFLVVPISCFQFHHQQQSKNLAFVHTGKNQVHFPQIQQQLAFFLRSEMTPLYSTRTPNERNNNNQGQYSYTEGDVFSNEWEELDSLGGDPAFLVVEEDTTNETKDETMSGGGENNNMMTTTNQKMEQQQQQSLSMNDKNDEKIKWEWDGEVDEEAHLGYE